MFVVIAFVIVNLTYALYVVALLPLFVYIVIAATVFAQGIRGFSQGMCVHTALFCHHFHQHSSRQFIFGSRVEASFSIIQSVNRIE